MNRAERRELERLRALVAELERSNERHLAAYSEALHRMVYAEQALERIREELDQMVRPARGGQ
jgi:hypothetical protein